jgi:threonyl-tRNA synthetase
LIILGQCDNAIELIAWKPLSLRLTRGSLERFTGILIEHFAGHLPLWLAPLQIVVATITKEADDYAMK